MNTKKAWIATSLLSYNNGIAYGLLPSASHGDVLRGCRHQWMLRSTSAPWNYEKSAMDQVSDIQRRNGAIYRQSVMTREELELIQNDIEDVMSQMHDETSSIAQHRVGASLTCDTETVRILGEGTLCQLVRRVTADDSMVLSSNLPVQIRSYEKSGANMAWHKDDVLYDPPQIEAVFTLENSSDCVTMWKDGSGIRSQETDPNSALLLLAGGPEHCVTSLKRGRRLILKCAYVTQGAKFRDGEYKDQFQSNKTNKGGKRKNRKSR